MTFRTGLESDGAAKVQAPLRNLHEALEPELTLEIGADAAPVLGVDRT